MNLLKDILRTYKNTLKEYISGKKEIPVGYYCSKYDTRYLVTECEYKDETYDERIDIEYYANSYRDLIKFLTHLNGDIHHDYFGVISLKEAKESFRKFVISKVAEKLQNYGLRHECVTWYLHNFKDVHPETISVENWGRYGAPVGESLKETRKLFYQYLFEIRGDIEVISNKFKRAMNIECAKAGE